MNLKWRSSSVRLNKLYQNLMAQMLFPKRNRSLAPISDCRKIPAHYKTAQNTASWIQQIMCPRPLLVIQKLTTVVN